MNPDLSSDISGTVFGYKDHFKGLGIFFDTFPNGNHDHSFPYISARVGDGKLGYDHANDNKGSLAGHGCEVFHSLALVLSFLIFRQISEVQKIL